MDEMLVSDLSESSGHNERSPFVRKTGGEGAKGEKANEGNHKSHERFREQGRWVLDCRGLKNGLTYMKDSRSVLFVWLWLRLYE